MKSTGMPVSLWVCKFRISVSLAVLNRIGHVLNEQGREGGVGGGGGVALQG